MTNLTTMKQKRPINGSYHANGRPRRITAGLLLAILFIASQTERVQPNWITQPTGFNGGGLKLDAGSLLPSIKQPDVNLNGFAPGTKVESSDLLDVIKARGFIGERYLVKSRDGTPLSVYHVINPYANPRTLNRFPVLVLHGVTTDAASMVAHSERTQARPPTLGQVVIDPVGDTSLALTLSSNNFDVWLADARGTNLNNHLYAQDLDPVAAQKFWDFSLDEQIHYDLPALIDFVLAQTHSEKLHSIGFSESTFFMFALMARSLYYQSKLASFVALAPVAYVNNIKGLVVSLFTLAGLTPDGINGNFIPQPLSDFLEVGLHGFCKDKRNLKALCTPVSAAVTGEGQTINSADFLTTMVKGTSIKSVKHFIQLHYQKRFGMFDHGAQENMRLYGSVRPPDYNLANINLPSIVLFRGAKDFLSDPHDQQLLLERLGTKPYRDFYYPNLNHIDFLAGDTVVRDVNQPAVQLMLELAKLNAAQLGARSVLRDPEQADKPAPYKPLVVRVPDGSREVQFKKGIAKNLVNGIVQTREIGKQNLQTLPGLNGLGAAFEQPFAGFQNLGSGLELPNFNLAQQMGALGIGAPFG